MRYAIKCFELNDPLTAQTVLHIIWFLLQYHYYYIIFFLLITTIHKLTLETLKVTWIAYRDSAYSTQQTVFILVTKISQSVQWYEEIIAICSEIYRKHTNTLCWQNIEFFNVKPGDTTWLKDQWTTCNKIYGSDTWRLGLWSSEQKLVASIFRFEYGCRKFLLSVGAHVPNSMMS